MARLIGRLVREPERWQVEHFIASLPSDERPDTWANILTGCLDGLGLAQGKACTTAQLASVCAAYPQIVKDGKWSERHFRRCVEDVMRPPIPHRPPTQTKEERMIDNLNNVDLAG